VKRFSADRMEPNRRAAGQRAEARGQRRDAPKSDLEAEPGGRGSAPAPLDAADGHIGDARVILAPGIRLRPLTVHGDRRGWLFEAFRAEWEADVAGAQVNVSSSAPGVLRGSHVHGRHTDYFVLAAGAAIVGLKDLRRASPVFGRTWLVPLDAQRPEALIVPPGVLHGLYFRVQSLLVSVESHFYDPTEEIRCRWDDPELAIPWPFRHPILSDNDSCAPTFAHAMRALEPWQRCFEISTG